MDEFLSRFSPDQMLDTVIGWLPGLVAAVLVMVLFYAAFRLTRPPLLRIFQRTGMHEAVVDLFVNKVYRAAVFTIGLVMAADQLGINVGAALAGIGVVGVAMGFAAQDTLANVIAGFMIFLDKPFQLNQWITVGEHYGKVNTITLRSTRIQTNRNTYVVIPNRMIIDTTLVNHSHHGATRVDVPVGIAYKENIPQARSVILAAVRQVPGVSASPAPDVVVTELAASGVNLDVRVWIDDAAAERPVHFRVMEAVKLALDQAGIEIPFPHLQLFIEQVEDRVWQKAVGMFGSPEAAARTLPPSSAS